MRIGIEPGDEGNKLGYYRVYGSQMNLVGGRQEHASPISKLHFHGAHWYVVHFTGFK